MPSERETPSAIAHTDHPLRHFDRTCPACIAESATATPRTDAETLKDNGVLLGKRQSAALWRSAYNTMVGFARQLERELAAAPETVIDPRVMDLVREHGSTMTNSEIVQKFLPMERLAVSAVATAGWIPCAERKPEVDTWVLCAGEFDFPGDWRIKMARLTRDEGWHMLGGSWTPTHWMPLPDAPGKDCVSPQTGGDLEPRQKSAGFCMYCGNVFHAKDDSEAEVARVYAATIEHDRQCPSNPLVARVKELEVRLSSCAKPDDMVPLGTISQCPSCEGDGKMMQGKPGDTTLSPCWRCGGSGRVMAYRETEEKFKARMAKVGAFVAKCNDGDSNPQESSPVAEFVATMAQEYGPEAGEAAAGAANAMIEALAKHGDYFHRNCGKVIRSFAVSAIALKDKA